MSAGTVTGAAVCLNKCQMSTHLLPFDLAQVVNDCPY